MRAIREWLHRLWDTIRPDRGRRDREEELRLHIELAAEDARRHGLPADAARRSASLRWGGVSQAMDALHDQRGLPWLDALRSDAVYAWRQLLRYRTASAAAILSLGLAAGATTAAFRLLDAVLLRPLPVADPRPSLHAHAEHLRCIRPRRLSRRPRLPRIPRVLGRRARRVRQPAHRDVRAHAAQLRLARRHPNGSTANTSPAMCFPPSGSCRRSAVYCPRMTTLSPGRTPWPS